MKTIILAFSVALLAWSCYSPKPAPAVGTIDSSVITPVQPVPLPDTTLPADTPVVNGDLSP